MKECSKCNVLKELSNFPHNKRLKSGYYSICKSCVNIINKNYRDNNKEKVSTARKKYYNNNIEKIKIEKKIYCSQNKVKKSLYDKEYRIKNKIKIYQIKKNWEIKNKNSINLKIKRNLRRRLHHFVNGINKSISALLLIGCDLEQFKKHIASQFFDGMTWNNYGEWHLDHIIPCNAYNLIEESEQLKCFNFLNYQPLWKNENLKKSKKFLPESIPAFLHPMLPQSVYNYDSIC